jgi:hypothetical protein
MEKKWRTIDISKVKIGENHMEKYSINVPHFYCLEYCEEDKKMNLDMDFRDGYFVLDKGLITHWERPYESEIISEDKKIEILRRVREFLLTKTVPSNIEYNED